MGGTVDKNLLNWKPKPFHFDFVEDPQYPTLISDGIKYTKTTNKAKKTITIKITFTKKLPENDSIEDLFNYLITKKYFDKLVKDIFKKATEPYII